MGAPRQGIKFNPRDFLALMLAAPLNAPARFGGLTGKRINLHPPTAPCIQTAKRQIDEAIFFGWAPFHDRPIGFADLALFEEIADALQRFAVTAEHKAA